MLHCAASCCVELCCSRLRCGSSYPWHPNPVRTDLGLKLKLPTRMVRPKLAAVETCGAFNQLELKIRFSSEVGRTDQGANPNRNETHRDDDKAPARHLLKQCKNQRFARDILNTSCRRSLSLQARTSLETSSTDPAKRAFRPRHPQHILMLVIRLGDLDT